MTKKDWKKTKQNKEITTYENKKRHETLQVGTEDELTINKKFFVDVLENTNFDNKFTKYFKTKSQALSFAKNYMRTH